MGNGHVKLLCPSDMLFFLTQTAPPIGSNPQGLAQALVSECLSDAAKEYAQAGLGAFSTDGRSLFMSVLVQGSLKDTCCNHFETCVFTPK